MPRLLDLDGGRLQVGDVLRLSDCTWLGPDTVPLDLMVVETFGEGDGIGLMVMSGVRAGRIFCALPAESRGPEGRQGLDIDWLRANWDTWFTYLYFPEAGSVPVGRAEILPWNGRQLVENI
jgi:hypothetical protein